MKLLHRVLALGVGLILVSPACTVEFGSMGNNGPNSEGAGGAPTSNTTYGGRSPDVECNLGDFSVEIGCACDEAERMAYFVRCGNGICMGPVCKFISGRGCGWEAQACPILEGGGGSPSTEPTLAIGGSLVTGSGGTPPGMPVTGSGGTPPGTPVSGGTTSVDPGTAVTGSGGVPPGTPASGGTTSSSVCPAVTLSIPSCGAGALTILYDSAGCVAGFVCLVN